MMAAFFLSTQKMLIFLFLLYCQHQHRDDNASHTGVIRRQQLGAKKQYGTDDGSQWLEAADKGRPGRADDFYPYKEQGERNQRAS